MSSKGDAPGAPPSSCSLPSHSQPLVSPTSSSSPSSSSPSSSVHAASSSTNTTNTATAAASPSCPSPRSGVLLVVSGPAGSGKTTIVDELLRAHAATMRRSVSYTTRAPRQGERPGIDYHFVSGHDFHTLVKAGAFVEHARVHGHAYGTPRAPVLEAMKEGLDVVLIIDVQGAMSIRKQFPSSLLVFVLPPSWPALEARLRSRHTDSTAEIAVRLATARRELGYAVHYDYVVCNDSLQVAVDMVAALVQAWRCRIGTAPTLARFTSSLSHL